MSSEVRVRFAPSPTGFLHIGGVRTALFNWLYARRFNGKFILRIEDTDLERSEERYTQDILASMKWLGMNADEDILYQSKRLDVYAKMADQLIAEGKAYRCYCTAPELEEMRTKMQAEGQKPMYDRRCRNKAVSDQPKDKPFVVRAKLPLDGFVEFEDLIRGNIRFENVELDDFVLVRSNGATTYNFSCVIDDVEQKMTHIIRGDDHINNTPKQAHLYKMFNYPQPKFAHLPMILGPDKKKLSKRHGAVSASLYRADGYLPETMLNFLARLGWSHGDQEVFTVEELTKFFDFDHVQKSSAVFNFEKLLWLNGDKIRSTPPARLAAIIEEDYRDHFQKPSIRARIQTEIGLKCVSLIQQKVKTVKEIAEQLVPLCTPGTVEVDASDLKWNKDANLKQPSQKATERLLQDLKKKMESAKTNRSFDEMQVWGYTPSLADVGFTHVDLEAMIRQISEQHGVKLGDLVQPIRLTITGRMVGASLFEVMPLLPFDMVEARLAKVSTL